MVVIILLIEMHIAGIEEKMNYYKRMGILSCGF